MKNKGSLFYSIFIILSLIASGMIIFFSSWLYLVTTANIEEEFSNGRVHSLEQTISTLESELQNIEYSFNAYSTTDTYQRVISSPLTPRDFRLYNEITTQLNYFSTPNLQNTTYTLISLDRNWMVDDNRLVQLTNEEVENFENYYVQGSPSDLFWDNSSDGMAVITLLPAFSRSKSGIGIATVSNQDIGGLINNRSIHFPVVILNNEGDVLYTSGENANHLVEQVTAENLDMITESNESAGEIRIDEVETPFSLIYNGSSHNNLLYLTALYDSEINRSLTPTRLGFIFLSVMLILFSIALAWAASNYLTKPLRELKLELTDDERELDTRNDFAYIRHSFESIRTQKESLETVLEVEKPALKRQFVLNAFLGRNTLEELDEKKVTYDFPIVEQTKFYVLVAQLDERVSKETAIRLFKLLHIIEEVISPENQLTPVVVTEENVATIVTFNDESTDIDKKLIEASETIITLAEEEADLLVSIGLSPEYSDFEETRENYKKAVRSLSYKLLLGTQSIISFEDIKSINTMSYADKDLSNLKDSIYKAIQLGNVQEAKNSTSLFLASLYRNSETPSIIEFGLLRFFINISELDRSQETEVVDRQLTERFYQNLLFNRNIIEIEDILLNEIIVPMTNMMEQRTTDQFQQLSNQIKNIIDERYEEDISLEMISDELNYNPNYISSIFKKETGVTFSDYLLDVRFDKAKEMLINTDMTVKEIAERLKYSNSQNFIRSFKKKLSTTPGKYRSDNQIK